MNNALTGGSLQDRVRNIIAPLIPRDAKERAQRAVDQWNKTVRDHIRTETGLKLGDSDTRTVIPVRVVDGFPDPLARLINDFGDPVVWRLMVGQPKLGGIIEGLRYLLEDWSVYEHWEHLPPVARGGEEHLVRALEIAEALQLVAIAKDVRERISKIEEDILGRYFFGNDRPPKVELYWMAIAMFAAIHEVRIEDLTVVVLAHELTHGYTHIGCDIDSKRWSDRGFGSSDLDVVEGLAQFYTQVISERLEPRAPGVRTAYERLLSLQSGPYRAHLEWAIDNSSQRGETIRFALVAARNHGQVDKAHWDSLLISTQENLTKKPSKTDQDRLFAENKT